MGVYLVLALTHGLAVLLGALLALGCARAGYQAAAECYDDDAEPTPAIVTGDGRK